jgi:hypothetical protein
MTGLDILKRDRNRLREANIKPDVAEPPLYQAAISPYLSDDGQNPEQSSCHLSSTMPLIRSRCTPPAILLSWSHVQLEHDAHTR